MASGITTTPLVSALAGLPLSVEYSLSLADYHALDMFRYDVMRKSMRFQLKFYTVWLIEGGAGAAIIGLMMWGVLKVLSSALQPIDAHVPLRAGGGAALLAFSIVLIGMVPGSFLHRMVRNGNEKRFRQARRTQLRVGLLRYPQRYRVVLTPEGFTETVTYCETGIAIEINEQKETRVWWAAVTDIDIAAEHAFFTVKDKGWLILPRAAFADEASFRVFVDTARSYRGAPYRAPAPAPQSLAAPDTRIAGELSR